YRRVPSGASESALGVLPSRGPAGGGSSSWVITRRVRVSTTATRSVLPEATNRRVPDALSASAEGWRAASMDPDGTNGHAAPGGASKMVISSPPHADTYTVPLGATATP